MAAIAPYRPSDVFSDLRREVDDAFGPWLARNRGPWQSQVETFFAPLDVHETDKEFTVRVDVPGMTERDIKVTCRADVLTISGERKNEKSENRGAARYSERTYGAFSRSMTLPTHVNTESIRAKYQNGVLEVVVPKAPSAQQREVKIET